MSWGWPDELARYAGESYSIWNGVTGVFRLAAGLIGRFLTFGAVIGIYFTGTAYLAALILPKLLEIYLKLYLSIPNEMLIFWTWLPVETITFCLTSLLTARVAFGVYSIFMSYSVFSTLVARRAAGTALNKYVDPGY